MMGERKKQQQQKKNLVTKIKQKQNSKGAEKDGEKFVTACLES